MSLPFLRAGSGARRLAIAALALFAMAAGPAAGDEPYRLTLLHTNDMHARVEPVSKQGAACSDKDIAENGCFGGWARMVTAIRAHRGPGDTLVLDAGDQFQGSLFHTFYKGADTAEFMGKAGYDAMAVGNHEYDDGPAVLARFAGSVPFPLLSANSDMAKEPALKAVIRPSTVVETASGRRIGVIGLTPEDTGTLTIGGKNVVFSDPIPAVKREVAALRSEGIAIILVLSHSVYRVDQRIAAAVAGISAIVGGHSHSYLAGSFPLPSLAGGLPAGPYPTLVAGPDGANVPIVQAGSNGMFLGRLDLVFDDPAATGASKASGGPILLDASVAEDPETKARIAELAKPLEELRSRIVAETAAAIDGARETCRTGECEMGDLVADAMLDRVAAQGAEIAIANGGGLRASIDEGPVSMGEVLTVLPFQNTLSTFTLTGADVVAALENGVSAVEGGSGRFPQVAGIEFDWSPTVAAGTGRVKAVRLRGPDGTVPIDPEKDYVVVSNNFLRGGGDGYSVFAQKGRNAYDYGPTLDSVLVDYLARQSEPYAPSTDGRIRRVE